MGGGLLGNALQSSEAALGSFSVTTGADSQKPKILNLQLGSSASHASRLMRFVRCLELLGSSLEANATVVFPWGVGCSYDDNTLERSVSSSSGDSCFRRRGDRLWGDWRQAIRDFARLRPDLRVIISQTPRDSVAAAVQRQRFKVRAQTKLARQSISDCGNFSKKAGNALLSWLESQCLATIPEGVPSAVAPDLGRTAANVFAAEEAAVARARAQVQLENQAVNEEFQSYVRNRLADGSLTAAEVLSATATPAASHSGLSPGTGAKDPTQHASLTSVTRPISARPVGPTSTLMR